MFKVRSSWKCGLGCVCSSSVVWMLAMSACKLKQRPFQCCGTVSLKCCDGGKLGGGGTALQNCMQVSFISLQLRSKAVLCVLFEIKERELD